MAVIGKDTNSVGIAEVHPKLDAGVGHALSIPVGDIDGVAQEGFVDRHPVPGKHQEVDLMDVEGVEFGGTVFDDPVFYLSLLSDDVGRGIGGIVGFRGLTVYGDHEDSRAVGVGGVAGVLGEVEGAGAGGLYVGQPGLSRRRLRRRGIGKAVRGIGGIGRGEDGCQGTNGVVLACGAGVDAARDEGGASSGGDSFEEEFHAACRRKKDVVLPEDTVSGHAVLVDGYAVEGDDAEGLRDVSDEDLKIDIGDGRGVQDAPELALHGFYGDDRRLVFGIGDGDEVDGEIARGLAGPRTGVEDVTFPVALNDGGGGVAGLKGLGIGMGERLIADD